jgi:hypothetical protein
MWSTWRHSVVDKHATRVLFAIQSPVLTIVVVRVEISRGPHTVLISSRLRRTVPPIAILQGRANLTSTGGTDREVLAGKLPPLSRRDVGVAAAEVAASIHFQLHRLVDLVSTAQCGTRTRNPQTVYI